MKNSTYTFEIYFSQDYQSEDQLYQEGQWYNIPRITNQPGFASQSRACQEARNLAKSFHELSGVKLSWRVVGETVVESGTI
jgi:hypothetical protein